MSTTIVPGSLIAAMIFSAGFAGFGLLVCLVVARLGTPIRGIWWLAGMCAAGMAYQLIIAAVHTAPNAAAVFEIKPWQHLCSLIQVYTMAGFLAVYMQLRYARTLLKIVGLPVGVLVLLIFIWSPTAQFQETYSLQVMHFPWGEQLSILHGKLGTAALIGRLLFLSFFIWALAHVFTQRAHDERTGANIITVGLLSLIVSLVIGYLVDSGVIDFIHTAGFGYIIFATLALYSVIQELEDRQTKLTHTATALTREMDEHRQARQTVEHLSFNDRLTDLPSRTGLFRLIDKAIATGKQQNSRFAVLHVDIDRFDVINDTLGPHVGDQLLRHVSVRLRNLLQGRDFVARINADEFVCVVSDPAAAVQAGRTAVSIHELLRSPFEIDNHVLHITASIGVAMYPDDADSVDTLMTAVDLATREAKRLGRDRTEIFHHELNTAIQERMHLGNALRVALAEQQFELYFQPQIDARSGQIAGLEALIRWHHPTRGMVPPDRFIPLAEEMRLIDAIGTWVIHETCRILADWRRNGIHGMRVAVNLSAQQLRQNNLADIVRAALERHGLTGDDLEMEVTESMIMEDPDLCIAQLQRLKTLGIKLAMDDFGTGYSSLAYLKRLPIDTLKIDRSFVRDLETDLNDKAICATTISMANSLGLDTVAEGVETNDQARMLRELHCDRFQGFFYARPMPAAAAADFIRQHVRDNAPTTSTSS